MAAAGLGTDLWDVCGQHPPGYEGAVRGTETGGESAVTEDEVIRSEDLGDLGDQGLGHQHHQGDRGPSHQHHSQSREVWSYGEPKSSRDRARILMGP